jgi:hypothetical protein
VTDGIDARDRAVFADNLEWDDEGHRLVAERLTHWMADSHL